MPAAKEKLSARSKSRSEIDKAMLTMLAERNGFKDYPPESQAVARDVLNWAHGDSGTDFGKRLGEDAAKIDGQSD